MCRPKLAELEPHVFADGWRWQPSPAKRGQWIGIDEEGRKWLVMSTGSFDAMRERVFDLIAQGLGLSCQSCIFITLPKEAEPLRYATHAEVYQGAITYIPPHDSRPCSKTCALEPWVGSGHDASFVRFLAEGRIKNATDLLVGNVLGYLFGASERLEFVISTEHRLFLVDNEYTLLGRPDIPSAIDYVRSCCADQEWQLAGEILIPKLDQFATLPNATLNGFTQSSPSYKIARKYPIRKRLPQFRNAARHLARELAKIDNTRSTPIPANVVAKAASRISSKYNKIRV